MSPMLCKKVVSIFDSSSRSKKNTQRLKILQSKEFQSEQFNTFYGVKLITRQYFKITFYTI